MNRKVAVAVAALAVIGGIVFWWTRRGGHADDDVAEVGSGSGSGGAKLPRDGRRGTGGEFGAADRVMIDDDPKGNLRLEGQVIDDSDKPVKGAIVVLSSNPARTDVTDESGGFSFDDLVGRPYTLTARAPSGVAGPVTARLTGKSDPVILKLRQGAKLTVTVTRDGKSVDGATVELRGTDEQRMETKAGVAVFPAIVPGGYQIAAWADGTARTFQWIQVGQGDVSASLSLVAGAPVSGTVVDEQGKGIAGANVRFSGASDWSQQGDSRLDGATTKADGAFELPALPAGSFRFAATHAEHAPGTSGLVTLDGKTPQTGVTITLADGATVAGKVIDAAGKPVSSARVRVASGGNQRGMNFEAPRQAFTDAAGAFEIKGLAKKPLIAVALHETGSSATKDVDTTTGDVRNVELTIDVTGTISGIVVDPGGQPIEGVQVTAGPSFDGPRGSGGADFSQWRLRGFPQELTDGSGKFTLTGLAPGTYTISAAHTARRSRRGPGVGDGVTAKTGDSNVKLTLAPEGAIKGKVAFGDGSAPQLYNVSVGFVGQPFSSSEFTLDGLPPQKYQVNVSGPSFQTRIVDVTIESGKTADLGTITVAKGRTIAGVVTADGRPVPNATVHVGRRVFGNGTTSNAQFGPMGQDTKHDTTDQNGAFSLSGFPEGDITIVAEHESIGRSKALRLPTVMPGQTELTLVLEKFGAVSGVLRKGTKPAESTIVSCQSTTTPGAIYSVMSGPDGSYRFDRLAPDTYKISAMLGMPMTGMQFYSKQVAVPSGGNVTIDLVVEQGTVTVEAQVTARNGQLGVGQATIISGTIVAKTYNELSLKMAASGPGASQFSIIRNGAPARFPEVTPGNYTVCIVPYPAEVKGFAAMGYADRHGDTLMAFCKAVAVQPSPDTQTTQIQVDLPPFVPDAPPGGGSGSGGPPPGPPPGGSGSGN